MLIDARSLPVNAGTHTRSLDSVRKIRAIFDVRSSGSCICARERKCVTIRLGAETAATCTPSTRAARRTMSAVSLLRAVNANVVVCVRLHTTQIRMPGMSSAQTAQQRNESWTICELNSYPIGSTYERTPHADTWQVSITV